MSDDWCDPRYTVYCFRGFHFATALFLMLALPFFFSGEPCVIEFVRDAFVGLFCLKPFSHIGDLTIFR